jgi:hypothetical protein
MWYRFLDVARALNFDLPSSIWEHSQVIRIARAGRGGVRTFVSASAL